MRFGFVLIALVLLVGCTASKERGDLPESAYAPQTPAQQQNNANQTAAKMIAPVAGYAGGY